MNISLLLESAAAAHSDRTAVVDGRVRLTYAMLERAACAWAAWMRNLPGPGPLVQLGGGGAAVVELLFGTAVSGRAFAPLNYRLGEAELARLIGLLQPSAIIVDERNHDKVVAAAGVAGIDTPVLDTDFRPPSVMPVEAPQDPSLPAVYLATSGTTSRPKVAILTHQNLFQYVVNTVEPASARNHEAVLVSAPPYHIATVAQVLSNVFRCRRLVFMRQFAAREWLELARAEHVTHAMVVPTMLVRVLDELERDPEVAPADLTTLSYGGSKAPPGLVERALRMLPEHVGLVNAFGLTETASTVCLLGPAEHRAAFRSSDPAVRARLDSVGKVIPGMELRIRRPDRSWAATDEVGEICVRGQHVSPGYVSKPLNVDAQGWLFTGDVGRLDGDGFLFVSGREDDVIIRGGENIDPAEIEKALVEHPLVSEAAVVGMPDAEWGEAIAAIVVVTGPVDQPDLQAWVHARLAGYKVPDRIESVPELPRNDMGKVVRRLARAHFQTHA